MKRLIFVAPAALLCFFAAPDAAAQEGAISFRTLQQALPSGSLAGFTRQKPTGSTNKTMGMAVSEASVRYVKSGSSKDAVTLTAKITDVGGMPMMGAFGVGVMAQVNNESETETSSTKTVTVKKYKASEETNTGPSKSCKLTIPVATRFLVEVTATNTDDVKLLYAIADSVAFDKLEADAAAK